MTGVQMNQTQTNKFKMKTSKLSKDKTNKGSMTKIPAQTPRSGHSTPASSSRALIDNPSASNSVCPDDKALRLPIERAAMNKRAQSSNKDGEEDDDQDGDNDDLTFASNRNLDIPESAPTRKRNAESSHGKSKNTQRSKGSNQAASKQGATRTMKSLFQQLEQEEGRRDEMAKVEVEELGFDPDREEIEERKKPAEENKDDSSLFQPDFDHSEGGKDKTKHDQEEGDSDASDGELDGEARKALFDDIFTAIDEFSQQYDGNTSYCLLAKQAERRKKEQAKLKKNKLKVPIDADVN